MFNSKRFTAIRLFLLLPLFLWATAGVAQVSIGPRVGLNYGDAHFDVAARFGEAIPTKPKLGFQLGAVVDVPVLRDQISFQSGLLYNRKGYQVDYEKVFAETFQSFGIEDYEGYAYLRYDYLELPIQAVYKYHNFQIGLGGYAAWGMGGRHQHDFTFRSFGEDFTSDDLLLTDQDKLVPVTGTVGTDEYQELLFDTDAFQLYRAFDYGLKAGFGYQITSLLVSLEYSHGLANLTPKYNAALFGRPPEFTEGVVQQNRQLEFSVVWLFSLVKEPKTNRMK